MYLNLFGSEFQMGFRSRAYLHLRKGSEPWFKDQFYGKNVTGGMWIWQNCEDTKKMTKKPTHRMNRIHSAQLLAPWGPQWGPLSPFWVYLQGPGMPQFTHLILSLISTPSLDPLIPFHLLPTNPFWQNFFMECSRTCAPSHMGVFIFK